MLFNYQQYDNLTLIFAIRNVSHLLIYKDNWNKSKVMRRVISELLSKGLFSKLYLGNNPGKYAMEKPEYHDCAIVRIRINGVNVLDYKPKTPIELFAKEMRKPDNFFRFDNEMIDEEHNVSAIGISLRVSGPTKDKKSEIQAA